VFFVRDCCGVCVGCMCVFICISISIFVACNMCGVLNVFVCGFCVWCLYVCVWGCCFVCVIFVCGVCVVSVCVEFHFCVCVCAWYVVWVC